MKTEPVITPKRNRREDKIRTVQYIPVRNTPLKKSSAIVPTLNFNSLNTLFSPLKQKTPTPVKASKQLSEKDTITKIHWRDTNVENFNKMISIFGGNPNSYDGRTNYENKLNSMVMKRKK